MKIFIKKDKAILAATVALGAVNAVGSALVAVILQRILDIAIQGDISGFWKVMMIMVIYITVLSVVAFIESVCGKLLLKNVTRNLRNRIFRGVMKKRPEAYYESNSADYLSAVINDVKLVEENYLDPLLQCCSMAFLFVATLGILCWLSPLVTGVLVGFMLLMFVVPMVLGRALQTRQEQYSQKLSEFTAAAKDFFGGFEVIRGFTVGGYIMRKFRAENSRAAEAKFRADRLVAVNESISSILSVLSTVVVVFVAAWLVLRGSITAGTLLALIQLSSTFSAPVLIIIQYFPRIKGMKPILQRLDEICSDEKSWERRSERSDEVGFKDGIIIRDVSFEYEPGSPVLQNINLCIKPGGKYAILGKSGCGKSTLIKLLTGYFRNYEGSVTYDGRNLRDLSREAFSGIVSVIHQNVYMFNTDIYENICLGENFTDEELETALERSGVGKFIVGLEAGVHTPVGENGSKLSGGQRQRVALARALIRNTPLLVLDEGTSAVDRDTALEIERQLLSEKDLTLITITHHMYGELECMYDEILHMERGRVSG